MAREVQFKKTLDKLFRQRTYWLRNILGRPTPGAPPKLDKRRIDHVIRELQAIASGSLATKLAKTEFSSSVEKKKRWHVKGRGREGKRRIFNEWYDKHIPFERCVYVFWNKKKCIYVGKTKRGAGRPSSHFDKYWFNGVTRVDVYALGGKRSLPALECLAIHRFQPKENKQKAQPLKWTRECPLCKVHRDIESELRSIFRLRG
jgi:hypothetical protein